MELSGLLNKLKKNSEEERQLFLAIQIDAEFVKTAIWQIAEEEARMLSIGPTQEWDGTSTEILLESVDASLSEALTKLPEDVKQEPDRVIFGLPQTWAGEEGVAASRLADLKHICEKLAFQPVGFVVTTEAIVQYLKSKEGTPLSAILVRVSKTEVVVAIVRLGKILGTHVVGRSGDLSSDVREGLARFGEQESLPSRMILYDGGEDMQDLTQQLMAYDWQSNLPFLHMPQIESVPEEFSITAIAMAGGGEVAKSLGFTVTRMVAKGEKKEEEGEKEGKKSDTETKEQGDEGTKKEIERVETAVPDDEEEKEAAPPAGPKFIGSRVKLPRVSNLMPRRLFLPIVESVKGFGRKISVPGGLKLTALVTAAGLLFLYLGVVYLAKHLPKAKVRLIFASQSLDQRVRVTVDPTVSEVNPDKNLLPAEKVIVTKSGELSKKTTGTKIVGDRATGEATIYNRRTDGGKTFEAGTKISSGNRVFTLDADVSVASASASVDQNFNEVITPGKAKIAVKANAIGPEYNLDGNTEFQVANFSKSIYVARNEAAFSGGTKREIQAVSKEDQSELRDSLLKEIKSQAAGEVESQSKGRRVFSETIVATAKDEKFSAIVGEEAGSLRLELTADVMALAINNDDFDNLLSAVLRDVVPEGYSLALSDLKITVENEEVDSDSVSFDALVRAKLSPAISKDEIISKITGRRPGEVEKELKSLAHYRRAQLEIFPNLPVFLRWMPAISDRITVEIELED